MDNVFNPSLECMTLLKIAVALWNQDDLFAPTAMNLLPCTRDERKIVWMKAANAVIEKVQGLPLPKPLKKKLLKFINGIGWEIFKGREHLYHRYKLDRVLPSELCWTRHGTIDTKKMAEVFIQKENIDVTIRYKLACNYCFEDDIPKLWRKIPENLRKLFSSEIDQGFLVWFWSYRLYREIDWHYDDGGYQRAFEYSACWGNIAATEYFRQSLTSEQEEESLVISAILMARKGDSMARKGDSMARKGDSLIPSYFPYVFCQIFFELKKLNQLQVFEDEDNLHHVLECLLEWPWQSQFMEMANHMWDFLSEKEFYRLLFAIVERVQEGYRSFDYGKIFVEFWQQSPNAHKTYVINELITTEPLLLSALFEIKDIENIRQILNSAAVEERKYIMFSSRNFICERLVDNDQWDSIKLFLQEFLTSKEVMIEFKEEFKAHIEPIMSARPAEYGGKKNEWDKFFQFLDNLIQDNSNKGSDEEAGESTSAKRICGREF